MGRRRSGLWRGIAQLLLGGGLLAGVLAPLAGEWLKTTPLWAKVAAGFVVILLAWLAIGFVEDERESSPTADDVEQYGNALRQRVREMTAPSPLVPNRLDAALYVALTPRPDAVKNPTLARPLPLPTNASFDDAFKIANKRLLVLGDKGAGKTFALYQLIENLTAEGKGNVVLVNASGWVFAETFEAGLIDYLHRVYRTGFPKEVAASWLACAPVVVVDGLDELGSSRDPGRISLRRRLLQQILTWEQGDDRRGVVISSRMEQWEELAVQAPSVHGVELRRLNDDNVDVVRRALAKHDPAWHMAVRSTRPYEALRTPLFAALAIEANLRVESLTGGVDEIQREICKAFVESRLHERATAKRYLEWIAAFLNGNTVSLWDHHSPDRVVFSASTLTPAVVPSMLRAVFGLVAGLVGGLIAGLLVFDARPTETQFRIQSDRLLRDLVGGLVGGLVFGLVGGLVVGLVGGLVVGLAAGLTIGLDDNLRSTRAQIYGEGFDDELRQSRRSLMYRLVSGLVFGLVLGLAAGLAGGLAAGLAGGLAAGLVFGLVVGLVFGLVVGMGDGGWFVALQRIARDRLRAADDLPRDIGSFCKEMSHLGIMRPSGLGYRFRHDVIQSTLDPT